MLIWVCALHCEAKPVIDRYRLKKSHADSAYDLYLNQDMICIISGPGKLASAAATAWVAAREPGGAPAWINLGTAGAAEHEIGSIFQLHQVIDADTGQRLYPAITETPILAGHAGLCLSQPSTEYRAEYLFDMESSGFLQSALRFSSAELIRCIKLVSDNRREQVGRDRGRISGLIQAQMESIDAQAQALIGLNQSLLDLEIAPGTWEKFLTLAHFSQTQKSRLKTLLRFLLQRNTSDSLFERLADRPSANSILQSLEAMRRQESEKL